ncbi:hypothetical protein BJ875DRAFT_502191 [Amylocarpus encephaloides]|uniref:Uncharacterized protein n=1 Tax=Amylocarpus encephaloides TaxID=45428 RepID=A0A9P7YSE6_9HELO|nr:hypothetical protein BJ875DRAFT_502191 [Amylocarpus encephaloides]
MALDATSPESIAAAAHAVGKNTGRRPADLINTAGLGSFEANSWAAVEMAPAFGPWVAAKGVIGKVAALGAILQIPWIWHGVSKAAMVRWTEVLRQELAPSEPNHHPHMDATVSVDKVVSDRTKGAEGREYRGGMSSGATAITTFMPNSMADTMLGGTDLNRPQELQMGQQAKKSSVTEYIPKKRYVLCGVTFLT